MKRQIYAVYMAWRAYRMARTKKHGAGRADHATGMMMARGYYFICWKQHRQCATQPKESDHD